MSECIISDLLCIPMFQPINSSTLHYLQGRSVSHLAPKNSEPGGKILSMLLSHSHIGYVWLIHFLPTFHKWNCQSYPSSEKSLLYKHEGALILIGVVMNCVIEDNDCHILCVTAYTPSCLYK